MIQTVLGPIQPHELGVTYAHEHLWCDQRLCRAAGRWPRGGGLMCLDEPDVIVEELRDIKSLGVGAVVEVTVWGWGRDVGRLREFARSTGVHIIATSGFYVEDCLPAWVHDLDDVDALAEALVQEVTKGADGTDVRPGVLKSAISRPVIEGVEARCARAVARAHLRTGLPITTHTSASARYEIGGGNIGLQHLDLFEAEGVDPGAVIVGHTDENADIRNLTALCRRGAFIQFDVIDKPHWLLDRTRAHLARQLVERGYGGHLLLSMDRNRRHELRRYGGAGYRYLIETFVPLLRAAGLDDAAIRQFLVDNPARAFARRDVARA